MSDTDTIFAQKQTIAVLRHRLAETAELKVQLAELRKMLSELHEINAELRAVNAELHKDKERLDWIQFTDLTLHHWEKGDVWSRTGVYTIREFIDKEM